MQEVFEKIKKKLGNLTHDNPMVTDKYILRKEAIEIVDEVAEEYVHDTNVGKNNGWIPCSERLPEDDELVLVCDEYGSFIIGWLYNDDTSNTGYVAESENEMMYDCIAWQPLPEAYKERLV